MSRHDELLIGFVPGAACCDRAAARIAAAAVSGAVAGDRPNEDPVAACGAARSLGTGRAPGISRTARTSGARR